MRECLEEGTVQAYVDGELSPPEAERVATHAGACAACAVDLSEAENELALLATALEPEFGLPVPSERLRERLDAIIGLSHLQEAVPEKARARKFGGWLNSLTPSFNFAPRYAFGFASLVAVIAFAAIFAMLASRQSGEQTSLAAVADAQKANLIARIQPFPKVAPPERGIKITEAAYPRPDSGKSRRVVRASRPSRSNESGGNLSLAESKPLPGEAGYLKTIASLTSIIETNGESALKPSLRGEYERNLALVNHAIDATRRTARRNPKNQDAAEFLYSSYQSKIELLSTVAEQGQAVAVLR